VSRIRARNLMPTPSKYRFLTIVLAAVIVAGASFFYSHSSKTAPAPVAVQSSQELAIENKGLKEFSADTNATYVATPQDKQLAEAMSPVITLVGDTKNIEKNREAVTALSKIIDQYPESPDAFLLRAMLSILVGTPIIPSFCLTLTLRSNCGRLPSF
jgi:hypothetical protein